jgi:hypothetical protein
VQSVLFIDGDLARPEDAAGAAFEAKEYARVVVERSPLDERAELGGDLLDAKTGPISPMQQLAPERVGSVRHSACFWPVSSSRDASHPWGYSATTRRIRPSSPAATRSFASFTIG